MLHVIIIPVAVHHFRTLYQGVLVFLPPNTFVYPPYYYY